ncbi:unnamed protein product [Aspergillus oryzae]|nr:unnamed protein product [Aspergillus oryzae]
MTQFNSPTDGASPSTVRTGLKCFWNWLKTPLGMLTTIYGLNVIAWGGMLFLLICNAAPAMCRPTCDDIHSARKKWIEIDSQILNALFCVPGFGLAPWRIRDLYFWVKWRLAGEQIALARLCDIHRSWFYRRPKGIDVEQVSTTTLCVTMSPPWKLDLVIWCNGSNTMFQACLAGCMWGMDRFNRPSWTTGLFVALACGIAGLGGWVSYAEGRRTRMLREVV